MSEKHFEIILSALADKIKAQETTILLQEFEIESFKKRLAEAENAGKDAPTKS